MKIKYFGAILFIAVLTTTSCTRIYQTARVQHPISYINTATTADFDVSDKSISFTYEPSKAVRRGGWDNVIKTAVQEALKANGGGDALIGLQYTVKLKPSLFICPIRLITVTGYPANYVNFRSLPDSIWEKTPLFPKVEDRSTRIFNINNALQNLKK